MEGHSERVAQYARMIAEEFGLKQEKAFEIETLAILHDVGKILIPQSLLATPRRLTAKEFEEVKSHAKYSEHILLKNKTFKDLAYLASLHHESWDGSGYPYGLKKSEIPYEARIITVADSFDAMTSWRPYREPLSLQSAIKELEKNADTRYWPEAVGALVDAVKRGNRISLHVGSRQATREYKDFARPSHENRYATTNERQAGH